MAVMAPPSRSLRKMRSMGFRGSMGSIAKSFRRNLEENEVGLGVEEDRRVDKECRDAGPHTRMLRIKIHYQDVVRGIMLSPEVRFSELVSQVSAKVDRPASSVALKFLDEDGHKISLLDDSDVEMAVETARDRRFGGKLEIWCLDR